MKQTVSQIERPDFPSVLRDRLTGKDWPAVSHVGNLNLLQNRLLGLLCSMRCPGEIILKTYDLARALRDARIAVIGGYHSPMEQECFEILRRGSQAVVICPARSIQSLRVRESWRELLEQDRLLVISPFTGKARRATADLALRRNELVADLADELLVLHASPGGKIEELCLGRLDRGNRVSLLEGSRHKALLERGAQVVTIQSLVDRWRTD
jgi:predicted Rossmann fold nucleotide-binding protein DprA/Smf involved in DNA uptake